MPQTIIKKAFNKFLIQTTIVSAFLLIFYFTLKVSFPGLALSAATPWLILFFLLIYNFVFHQQLKATVSRTTQFVNIFIISTGFKLLFFLSIIVVYALVFRSDAVSFIITFFSFYLVFTVLEVFHIKSAQNKLEKFKS